MKYLSYLIISLFCIISVQAQLTVTGTHPTNGATNVSLTDTIRVTFSSPLDTLKKFTDGDYLITNLEATQDVWYSQDLKTLYIKADLIAEQNYFLLFYSVVAEDGSKLETPALIEFTTSSSFGGVNVSGTVTMSNGNISPENSVVALSLQDLLQGEPLFSNAAVTDVDGNYIIHHVKDGTYFPLAAKDVNEDGEINPGYGDVLGFLDSIIVAGIDITNLNFLLEATELISFSDARNSADSLKTVELPVDALLYYVTASNIDSLGKTDDWSFYYISSQEQKCYSVDITIFNNQLELASQDTYDWISQMRPIGDSVFVAADPENFVISADNGGGNFFRTHEWADTLEFEIELNLGNLSMANFNDLIPGDNNFYWGLDYRVRPYNYVNWDDFVARLRFLADYETGNILIVSDVEENHSNVPDNFILHQNFPNPFNPSTTISWQSPVSSWQTLKVYDVLGNEVATLVNEEKPAGSYEVNFDAAGLTSGIYFYQFKVGKFVQTKKMILLR